MTSLPFLHDRHARYCTLIFQIGVQTITLPPRDFVSVPETLKINAQHLARTCESFVTHLICTYTYIYNRPSNLRTDFIGTCLAAEPRDLTVCVSPLEETLKIFPSGWETCFGLDYCSQLGSSEPGSWCHGMKPGKLYGSQQTDWVAKFWLCERKRSRVSPLG